MPVVVAEELAIAGDLTNEQLGALYRIKLKLWRANGFLPEDKLVSASGARKRWGKIMHEVLDHLTIAGGQFSCGAVMLALLATRERRAKRVERASAAANIRWKFSRAHEGGKPVSSVLANEISDALLTADKSLKDHGPSMLGASSGQCLDDANQNQNDLAKQILNSGDASAGGAAGLSEDSSRSSAGDNDQRNAIFKLGIELLISRLGLKKLAAHSQVSAWLKMVGNPERLAQILGAADQENLHGSDFFGIVEQLAIGEKNIRERGLPLPLDRGKPRALKGGRDG